MNNITLEQLVVDKKAVGDNARWLLGQAGCIVTLWDGQPIPVTPPSFVELEVIEIDPGSRGGTTGIGDKPAALSTGTVIRVPLFVQISEMIGAGTRSGEYVFRIK